MESTTSLSQGAFLFMPDGYSLVKQRATRKKKLNEKIVFRWESAYSRVWGVICQEINEINKQLFRKVLKDLLEHMKNLPNSYKLGEEVIPCEILLAGSNLPDHKLLLSTFVSDVTSQITPYVASLWSWNCANIRTVVHNFVSQIIPVKRRRPRSEYDFGTDVDQVPVDEGICKKNYLNINLLLTQYNMSTLAAWYRGEYKDLKGKKPAIVIVIPDFESFIPSVLGEFILLLSSYASDIPFVLVFGVATTPVTVYQSLPRKVLSQLVIQIFRSEQSPSVFNNVFDSVLLSEKCPLRLGEKCVSLLTDIFLFHSFSVHAFVQGFRYCLVEHLYKRDHYVLCCTLDEIAEQADQLSAEEIENIRRISSFQKYVESKDKEERKLLLLDNDHTREVVKKMIKAVLEHSRDFYYGLKILHTLTSNLPQSPLGRNLRQYYCKCISSDVQDSNEYKECMKLLGMQSNNELTSKINSLIKMLNPDDSTNRSPAEASAKLKDVLLKLEEFKKQLDTVADGACENGPDEKMEIDGGDSFEEIRKNFLAYIEEGVVKALLRPPRDFPLREIIYFDDVGAVRRRISGSPRCAIHLALNNPQSYMNCNCCVLSSSDAILPTLPDLSIAYKIHLEHNKIINMYDWLQRAITINDFVNVKNSFRFAFKTVLVSERFWRILESDVCEDGMTRSFAAVVKENRTVSEEDEKEIQARFTRAISELQFLGFIKPSRVKVDHVARLTWEHA